MQVSMHSYYQQASCGYTRETPEKDSIDATCCWCSWKQQYCPNNSRNQSQSLRCHGKGFRLLLSGFVVTWVATWEALGQSFLNGSVAQFGIVYVCFSSSFSASVITSLSIGLVNANYYTLTNSFKGSFKPYTKVCIVSYIASSGNATTTLLNTMIYSKIKLHYCSFHNLPHATFLSFSGAQLLINSFSNSEKLYKGLVRLQGIQGLSLHLQSIHLFYHIASYQCNSIL